MSKYVSGIFIVKKLKIKNDRFSLFSKNYNYYRRGEYKGEDAIDGYEVYIISKDPGEDKEKSSFEYSGTDYTYDLEYFDSYFIGDRNPGDFGFFTKETKNNSMLCSVDFNQEAQDIYLPIFMKFIQEVNDFQDVDGDILSILTSISRDIKINKII